MWEVTRNEYSEKNPYRWTRNRDSRGHRRNSMHDLVNLMSDILNQDAVLSVTILKPSKNRVTLAATTSKRGGAKSKDAVVTNLNNRRKLSSVRFNAKKENQRKL